MSQDETVARESDGQQKVDPWGPKVQESISSEVATKEAQRCLRCDYRQEGV